VIIGTLDGWAVTLIWYSEAATVMLVTAGYQRVTNDKWKNLTENTTDMEYSYKQRPYGLYFYGYKRPEDAGTQLEKTWRQQLRTGSDDVIVWPSASWMCDDESRSRSKSMVKRVPLPSDMRGFLGI